MENIGYKVTLPNNHLRNVFWGNHSRSSMGYQNSKIQEDFVNTLPVRIVRPLTKIVFKTCLSWKICNLKTNEARKLVKFAVN